MPYLWTPKAIEILHCLNEMGCWSEVTAWEKNRNHLVINRANLEYGRYSCFEFSFDIGATTYDILIRNTDCQVEIFRADNFLPHYVDSKLSAEQFLEEISSELVTEFLFHLDLFQTSN